MSLSSPTSAIATTSTTNKTALSVPTTTSASTLSSDLKQSSTSSTTAAAAAFWELDIPINEGIATSTESISTTTTSKKSKLQQPQLSSSSFLKSWILTQITTAVGTAISKHPLITSNNNNNNTKNETSQHEVTPEQQIQQHTATILYNNLITAVQTLQVTDAVASTIGNPDFNENNDEGDEDNDEDIQTSKKRRKITLAARKRRILTDPYHIWFQRAIPIDDDDDNEAKVSDVKSSDITYWNDEQDDLPISVGGKLAILSIGGILNGISLSYLSKTPILPHQPKLLLQQAVIAGTIQQWKQQQQLHNLQSITITHLHTIATLLHIAITEQVKYDIVRTTPMRIQMLLAADLTNAEFQSVRKRLHDTVILGKGVQQSQNNGNTNSDEMNDTTLAVGGIMSSQQHAIDKYKKCPGCGNNDQSEFILDRKNGDLICIVCGIVVSESIMHEGTQYRKFEGEVDRNHNGDMSNPLYSNAYNMSTSLSTVMPTMGAGMGGRGTTGGGRRNLETILKNAHAYTELNVSQFNRTDARRTRVGYKDRQKKSAFAQMTHAGDALNLHEAVVQRAKELFAGFRDDRELVQQFKGILAACLCEAFEQLSAEGKHLLRQQQQMSDQLEQKIGNEADDMNPKAAIVLSGRAARRSELHHATMAGKGGLLLNTRVDTAIATKPSPATTSMSEVVVDNDDTKQEKSATTWDLEDCRSWLLNASRRIAQAWVDEAKNNPTTSNVPKGSVDELEGRLVEHAITLCEHLENELQSRASLTKSTAHTRVVTPRLNDMTKLGIKWQHSHERGSGGKGGVGGSGITAASTVNKNQRTAGQILLLKTSKKLGDLLKDPIAGEAIHRELRAVISRQEALKQKEMRDEATRQRLNQMQRKPWLAAKAQQ